MKNFCILVFLWVGVPIFSSRADIIYPDGSKPWIEPYTVKKLSRGIANSLTFAAELPKTLFDVSQEKGILSFESFSSFVTLGPYKAVQRLGSGLYDVGTAFSNNESLLHLEPEILDVGDVIPGYRPQFYWETIDTPASGHAPTVGH